MLAKEQEPSGWHRHSSIATIIELNDNNGIRTALIELRLEKQRIKRLSIVDLYDDEWNVLKQAQGSREPIILIASPSHMHIEEISHFHDVYVRALD